MLYYGYQMGYQNPRNELQAVMRESDICLDNVSAWCESEKCAVRKPLAKMTYKELVRAISQFELVYKSFNKSYAGK